MPAGNEIYIEGRGLAAHNLAAKLADGGYNVLLGGPEYTNPRSWFVLGDRLPPDVRALVASGEISSHHIDACRFIIIDSASDTVKEDFTTQTAGKLDPLGYIMIDDDAMKGYYHKKIQHPNISIIPSSVRSVRENGSGHTVVLKSGEQHDVATVVDASGSASTLLRSLETNPLTDDALVLWIYGWRVHGQFDSSTMIFPLKDKSTGRLSWITPWSANVADILAADYCRVSEWKHFVKNGYFQNVYEQLRHICENNGICSVDQEVTRIYGRTRVVPIESAFGGDGVFAVGDAAGQACPNMAEGIPPALRNSTYLAEQLIENVNYRGEDYFKYWRFGPQKYEQYALSTALLLARQQRYSAGNNADIYKAISNADVGIQSRLLAERKLRVCDIPHFVRAGIKDPTLFTKAVSLLIQSRFVFTLRRYRKVLYG